MSQRKPPRLRWVNRPAPWLPSMAGTHRPMHTLPRAAEGDFTVDHWNNLLEWTVAGIGFAAVIAALLIGALSWLLNHPRD